MNGSPWLRVRNFKHQNPVNFRTFATVQTLLRPTPPSFRGRSTCCTDFNLIRNNLSAERLMDHRSPANVLAFFEQNIAARPESVALRHGTRTWSYTALAERQARFAHRLVQAGAGPGKTIGLCLERSPELIISVLGILRTGAAYVPIDPTYPADRIALMLEDAAPPVVITDKSHQHLFSGSNAHGPLDRGHRTRE